MDGMRMKWLVSVVVGLVGYGVMMVVVVSDVVRVVGGLTTIVPGEDDVVDHCK